MSSGWGRGDVAPAEGSTLATSMSSLDSRLDLDFCEDAVAHLPLSWYHSASASSSKNEELL